MELIIDFNAQNFQDKEPYDCLIDGCSCVVDYCITYCPGLLGCYIGE